MLLCVASSFALPIVAYAGIPEFGPIIPKAYSACPAGWGLLIQVINNIISFLITIAIVFVAPLMIAYSGFLFVVNPVKSGGIEKAKSILTNTVIGIVVALAAYLIVAALMAVLYNANASNAQGGTLGTWTNLISINGDLCLKQAGTAPNAGLNQSNNTYPGVAITPGAVSGAYYQRHADLLTRDATGTNWTAAEKDQLYTGSQAMSILDQADIEVNRGYSPVAQNCGTQCTSLNGIPKTTITTLVNAKANCTTCTIVVTGGTEQGHSSQGFGRASIDLRYDQSTYSYFASKGIQVVREAPSGSAVCGTSDWKCYSHVTAQHMSVYTAGGTVTN